MKIISGTVRGITLAEIMVSIAIIALLAAIGITSFLNSRSAKQLETTTDAVAARLHEAKTSAISGKNGTNFGVAFSSTTYTLWRGSSYDANSINNRVVTIPSGLTINTNLPGPSYSIMFTRITGTPSTSGNITVSKTNDASTSDTISVGAFGDITVIK